MAIDISTVGSNPRSAYASLPRTVVVRSAAALGAILVVVVVMQGIARADGTAHPVVEASPVASVPAPIGPEGRVRDSVEVGGRLFVAGDFTSIGGVDQAHLAEIDTTTGAVVQSFDVEIGGGSVYALAASPDGSTLYLGGRFKTVDGERRTRLAAIDLSSQTVLPWNPTTDRRVSALATNGSIVLAGGDFNTLGGIPTERLGAIDAVTGQNLGWNLAADEEVHDLEWNGYDLVYAAGEFLDIGGSGRSYLASIDLTTGAVSSWNPTTPFMIWDVALDPSGEWVYAAEGGSLALGGNRLSKFHSVADGRPWWTRQADGDYQAVATDGQWVYAGGHFDYEGKGIEVDPDAPERRKLLSVRATDGELTDWNPHFTSVLGIWHLRVTTGGLIVGGDFDRVNWFPQGKLARFEGPLPSPLLPPPAKPQPLPEAECTTQFTDGYRTITVVSFQSPDEFVIRRNGSWLVSPPVGELVITPFTEFGGGYATQWSLTHDLPLDGSFHTRMSVDGGPRLALDCVAGAPLVDVPPIDPPEPEPEPEPGDATCTVTNRLVEFDAPADRIIIRRNGSWAHTTDAGAASWTDPAGQPADTYLIRFTENDVRRDVSCDRMQGEPEPEPTCTTTQLANGDTQISIELLDDPRSLVLRRDGRWLATLPDLASTTYVDAAGGDYVMRFRMSGGPKVEIACTQA